MSVAANVDIELDQGADFGLQIYWTDPAQTPFTVLSPMRMEIRADTGQVIYTLITNDTAPVGAVQTITYNSVSGLIQLNIPASDTASFKSGIYNYDLFVTYQNTASDTKLKRLLYGNLFVNQRITKAV